MEKILEKLILKWLDNERMKLKQLNYEIFIGIYISYSDKNDFGHFLEVHRLIL